MSLAPAVSSHGGATLPAAARYDVVPVDAAADADLFVAVRRAALGPGASSRALHHWQYRQAPSAETEAFVLRALDGDRAVPVGWISIQGRRVAFDGEVRRAGLLVNLVVAPEHRTVLPALMLQRAAAERARSVFDLSYGYPNHAALGGFLRARYQTLGPIVRYACPLGDHRAPLGRLGLRPELAAVLGRAADVLLPTARRALWWRWRQRYAIDWLDEMDHRLDDLWRRAVASTRGRVIGDRSAAFLEWRLRQHPTERHDLAVLIDRERGTVAGYAAVRWGGPRAVVGDFFALEDADYEPLVDGLLAALVEREAVAVEVSYLGRPAVIEVLRRRGFRPREEIRTVIVDPGQQGPAWIREPERWHLTAADGDL